MKRTQRFKDTSYCIIQCRKCGRVKQYRGWVKINKVLEALFKKENCKVIKDICPNCK